MLVNNKKNSFLKEFISWVPYVCFFILDKDFRNAFERLSWSKKQMEEFLFLKLKSIISFAFENSPFYQEIYKKAKVKPEDFKNISDIQKFPIITKKDLRLAIKENKIFTQKKFPFLGLKTSTTGSTGNPLTLFLDFSCRKHRFINTIRAFWMVGVSPEKKFVLLWRNKKLSFRQFLKSKLGLFYYIPVVDVMDVQKSVLTKEKLLKILNKLVSFKPQVIRGYTSALWVLTQLVKKYKIPITPESIIASAEYLPHNWWQEMEEVFHCPVHNLYGGTEASPIAISLYNKKELTVFQDSYFTEIVNTQNKWVEEGKVGRILITDYSNYYMPLIRYEIGDIAEWSKQEHGPFPCFKEVYGRINDIFILPGGKILFSHNWHIYFRDINSISQFKVIQRDFDEIDIYLSPSEGEEKKIEEDLKKLKPKVQESLGKNIKIKWEIVKNLELDPGEKFRQTQSLIDPQKIIEQL
jgi:phenylacetate-CoA ligase